MLGDLDGWLGHLEEDWTTGFPDILYRFLRIACVHNLTLWIWKQDGNLEVYIVLPLRWLLPVQVKQLFAAIPIWLSGANLDKLPRQRMLGRQ